MNIKQDILPVGHRNRPGHKMNPKGLLVHATSNWNDAADAKMHAEYMRNTKRTVSWHLTSDAETWIQHIPFHESAWHAGDGINGHYNRNWIGQEICCNRVNPGESLDEETYQSAVKLSAYVVKIFNFTRDQVQPHQVVYGKNCPHNTLLDFYQYKEDVFQIVEKETVPPWKMNAVKWLYEEGFLTSEEWKERIDEPLPLWAEAIILQRLFKRRG